MIWFKFQFQTLFCLRSFLASNVHFPRLQLPMLCIRNHHREDQGFLLLLKSFSRNDRLNLGRAGLYASHVCYFFFYFV